MYDCLILEGVVVDPANGVHGRADVAIDDGKIAGVGRDLAGEGARQVLAAGNRWVLPGLIDAHVHISSKAEGHRMMARSGVTCALDLAGRPEEMIAGLREAGAGLSVGFVYPLIPGDTVSGRSLSAREISKVVDQALSQGALGVKVVGGHYPLTPEATARVIRVAHDKRAWCAVHAGTLNSGSNINGLEELVDLSGGLPLHIAHVNSYCRGQATGDPLCEASRALRALARAPAARCESYLSLLNGTNAAMEEGLPKSQVTRTCLATGGYDATDAGMENAISEGWAQVHGPRKGEIVLLPPDEGLRAYRERQTEVYVSFAVNSPSAAIALAIAKTDGGFAVDALSTDGGGIPRNTTLKQGLALVRFGALSLEELVIKACVNPARMLGVTAKGHLGPGADADLIVVDPVTGHVEDMLVEGRRVIQAGEVVGHGGQLLTTEAGSAFLDESGMESRLVSPAWLDG